jgi:hypothetical protein
MKKYGEVKYSSTILDFGISFMPWPLYLCRKSPHYPLDKMQGGPQSIDAVEQRKISCPCQELNPSYLACHHTDYILSQDRCSPESVFQNTRPPEYEAASQSHDHNLL